MGVIPMRRDGLQVETMDGELIVLDTVRDVVVHANATAALVFQLCDGQRSVDDITALLCDAYPDSAADIRADVPAIIAHLVEQRLLEWSAAAT